MNIDTIEANGYIGTIETMKYAEKPDYDGQGAILSLWFVARKRVEVEHADYGNGQAVDALADAVGSAYDRWGSDWDKIERYLRAFHGVVSFDRTHWDRGADLLAIVTQDMIDEWGCEPEGSATSNLYAWQAYRDGEVYGYAVESPSGETLDSCSGYYGDRELPYLRLCIKEAIDTDRARVHESRVAMYRKLISN